MYFFLLTNINFVHFNLNYELRVQMQVIQVSTLNLSSLDEALGAANLYIDKEGSQIPSTLILKSSWIWSVPLNILSDWEPNGNAQCQDSNKKRERKQVNFKYFVAYNGSRMLCFCCDFKCTSFSYFLSPMPSKFCSKLSLKI